jgi:DNA-binding NarL/FixJ family response regulator
LISAYEEEGIIIGNLPENIKGFLLKDMISKDLVDAVRKVDDGFYVFSREILANYLEYFKEIDDSNTNYIVFEENPFSELNKEVYN